MKRFALVFSFVLLTSTASALEYEPYTYHQDFETGELMAWSSYPPIQDTAYEAPYIYPGKIHPRKDGVALLKIIHPPWPEPQLTGVVKRLPMRLDARSRIKFRYYVKATVEPSWLAIDLPLADGDRIRARFQNIDTNRWIDADYTVADILAAAGRKASDTLDITALALFFRFEQGDTDMPVMLGFDDFEISGLKPASFSYDSPRTVSLEEWDADIALRHFRNGETLVISGRFPTADPDKVVATISQFDKPEVAVAAVRLGKKGDRLVTRKPIQLTHETYPAGMYEVTLTATTGKETVAEDRFTFLVIDDSRIASHPRFWFTEDTKAAYVNRLSEEYPEFLADIRRQALDARERLDPGLPYDLPYFPKKGWLSSFEAYRTRIATIPQRAVANALVYTVGGDREAADWAKRALLNLAEWPTWTHPWMVNRGHKIYLYQVYTTYHLALAYDILYNLLSESERALVRDAFVRNGLEPAYCTYVVADQVTCNESNWITAVVGGSLAAACAVMGDAGDTSALEPYLSGCLYKMRAHMETVYGGDSGCIEGFGYGYGTMRLYAELLPIIEHSLGLDMTWMLGGSYGEAFWTGDHDRNVYYSFGDAHLSGGNTFSCFPWLLNHFRDPELAWLYDRNKPTPAFYTYYTTQYDLSDIPRKEPDLSGAKWFKTTGTVVFRSETGPDPFILTFRSGPFGNHQHLDQGTFFLHDHGETLVTELGYSSYYNDPYYQSHVSQPVGHNCILVDGNPQSQRTGDHADYAAGMRDHATIRDFVAGKSLGFAQGDLTPLYVGNVSSLRRGIVYIHPRTVIVIDRLTTKRGEATMDALYHGPTLTNTAVSDAAFSINAGAQTLAGTVLLPDSAAVTLEPDPVTLAHFTDDPVEPTGKVTVRTETEGGEALLAVLLSTDDGVRNTVAQRGAKYIELEDGAVFLNPPHEMIEIGRLGTDGVLAAMTDAGALLVVEATHGSIDNRRILHADVPMTLLMEGSTVHYSTDRAGMLRIQPPGKVSSVLLNGENAPGWKRDGQSGEIYLDVPAGQGTIELKERRM
ncbi:MAG: heparinase II/III family protein [Candidatus Latescibacteria bacterium]|nr:heparinase II/III family protein [Candidatus Latescibacterota bacterium]